MTNFISYELDNSINLECQELDRAENCQNVLTANYNLKILTFNIRSIQRNFNSFCIALRRLNIMYDVIVLTECWLSDGSLIGQIEGYTSYYTVNNLNQSGGVVTYIRDCWNATVSEPPLQDAESLLIVLSNNISIIAIYRSPSRKPDSFISSLDEVLASISNYQTIVVTGDININLLSTTDVSKSDYLCLMSEHGLKQVISKPTRQNSCLDHIFLKSRHQTVIGLVCDIDITDHRMAMMGYNMLIPTGSKYQQRSINKINFPALIEELKEVDWSGVVSELDVNNATNEFHNILTSAVQKHSVEKIFSRSKYIRKPWITPGLIRCMNHRDKLHRESNKHPNDQTKKLIYNRYRNFFTNIVHRLKREHDSKKLEDNKNNIKGLWKAIRNISEQTNNRSNPNELLKSESSAQTSINNCNNYFSSVGKNLASKILADINETQESVINKLQLGDPLNTNFFMHPTDVFEIDKIITNLRNDSAPGPDNFTPTLIKEIKTEIIVPLTHIINLSLDSGTFPNIWKEAQVTPVHKSGSKQNPSNYRPISLLAIFSKILEKAVNHRLTSYLDSNNLISNKQFGFRQGKSTEDAVSLLAKLVTSYLDENEKCIGIFLDLAKAFDTVAIPILLKKLETIGIRGLPLKWFETYLTNRRQCVKIGDTTSCQSNVEFGVPQGSVLGPTLFIIYINDIHHTISQNAEVICYADDTAIIFHSKSWEVVREEAQNGLISIKKWLDLNLLSLNIKKTNYICFHKTLSSAPKFPLHLKIHPSTCSTVSCTCEEIKKVESLKYLGVLLDEHLSFRPHIDLVAKRIRKLIHVMKLLRNSANKKILHLVYVALCESVLCYCITVWGGVGITSMIQLERAQRSVLKVMYRKHYRYPTDHLYKEASVLNVRQLYILKLVLKQHKITIQSTEYHHLLKQRIFKCPLTVVKTAFAQRMQEFMLSFVYNKIAKICDIKNCRTYQVKKITKQWLLTQSYSDSEAFVRVIS